MKATSAAVLATIMVLASQPAWASSQRDALSDERASQLEERMKEAKERLDLSEEQLDLIAPVLEEAVKSQRAVLSRYGINPQALGDRSSSSRADRTNRLTFREMRQLRSDLELVVADASGAWT